MDRFEWSDFTLQSWEAHVTNQTGVALYDGNDKVTVALTASILFVNGRMVESVLNSDKNNFIKIMSLLMISIHLSSAFNRYTTTFRKANKPAFSVRLSSARCI